MTRTKSLIVACAAIACSFGSVVAPASAQMMMKKPMMHHHMMDGKMMMHKKPMMHHRMMHKKMMNRIDHEYRAAARNSLGSILSEI